MEQLRARGLALAPAANQLVARLRESIVRHEGAQQQIEAWWSPMPEQVSDYMRATRQVLALATRSVVARVDLWLQGESALGDATSALDSLAARPHHDLPFDIARTVNVVAVRQLALDVDEVDFQCVPVEQAHGEDEETQHSP